MPDGKTYETLRAMPVALGMLAAGADAVATPLALDPPTACQALADEGLGARTGYDGSDTGYRCTSRRKPLAAGGSAVHEVRFYAAGDATSVHRLVLELDIRSREDIQRAHGILARYATTLTQRLLQTGLPEAVNDAILSAVGGTWSEGGRQYTLRRDTASGPAYELRLTIE